MMKVLSPFGRGIYEKNSSKWFLFPLDSAYWQALRGKSGSLSPMLTSWDTNIYTQLLHRMINHSIIKCIILRSYRNPGSIAIAHTCPSRSSIPSQAVLHPLLALSRMIVSNCWITAVGMLPDGRAHHHTKCSSPRRYSLRPSVPNGESTWCEFLISLRT